jgi:hypothetical protein
VNRFVKLVLVASCTAASALAQDAVPPKVLGAKTVIVLNETHTMAVEDGAEAELKQWGHLRLVETTDEADIVIQFDKKTEHSPTSSDPGDGKSWSGGVTFGTHVNMTATERGGFAPFFQTRTDDSKEKAGRTCVQKLISSWQDAQRRAAAQ